MISESDFTDIDSMHDDSETPSSSSPILVQSPSSFLIIDHSEAESIDSQLLYPPLVSPPGETEEQNSKQEALSHQKDSSIKDYTLQVSAAQAHEIDSNYVEHDLLQGRIPCQQKSMTLMVNEIYNIIDAFTRVESDSDILLFLEDLECLVHSQGSVHLWPVVHDLKLPAEKYLVDIHIQNCCVIKLCEVFSSGSFKDCFNGKRFKKISEFKRYIKSLIVLDSRSRIDRYEDLVFHIRSPEESLYDFVRIVRSKVFLRTGTKTTEAPPGFIPMVLHGLRSNYKELYDSIELQYHYNFIGRKYDSVESFLLWLLQIEKNLPARTRAPSKSRHNRRSGNNTNSGRNRHSGRNCGN